MSEEPVFLSYDEAFKAWARQVVYAYSMIHKDVPAFDLEQFDGCTAVPDWCLDCCLVHDLHCYYEQYYDRAQSDALFRQCMIMKAKQEHEWMSKVYTYVVAWAYYLGVRGYYRGRQWLRSLISCLGFRRT